MCYFVSKLYKMFVKLCDIGLIPSEGCPALSLYIFLLLSKLTKCVRRRLRSLNYTAVYSFPLNKKFIKIFILKINFLDRHQKVMRAGIATSEGMCAGKVLHRAPRGRERSAKVKRTYDVGFDAL